jgi:hypothetical protein
MASGFMPIGDFKVTYRNGETAVAQSNFRGIVEVERRWPGDEPTPGVEAMGLAVWHYLDCPGEFDDWLISVHTIEAATTEGEVAPEVPTDPTVGDG